MNVVLSVSYPVYCNLYYLCVKSIAGGLSVQSGKYGKYYLWGVRGGLRPPEGGHPTEGLARNDLFGLCNNVSIVALVLDAYILEK